MDAGLKTRSAAHRPGAAPRARWWLGALALLLGAGVVGRVLSTAAPQAATRGPASAPGEQSAPRVTTVNVALTRAPLWLDATGTVEPGLDAPIASKVMGRVASVLVREGDRVRAGQRLVVLEERDLAASVRQAAANLRSADVAYDSARVGARMEGALSIARIQEAEAKLAQSEAALRGANAKLALVLAGPRRQEREQASLAVEQATVSLALADDNARRMSVLYQQGAISAQQYEQYRTRYAVAQSALETAVQSKSMADEGSRAEDVHAARQDALQAGAAVTEARAGLASARASSLQAAVRERDVESARAQIGQSRAGLQLAEVSRDYATLVAPFDGIVSHRMADPGAMASPGTPLIEVQSRSLRLNAIVPESAMASIAVGVVAPIRFDAVSDRAMTGRVIEIAPQGDAGSHTFIVKVDLPRVTGARAGMYGRARFQVGTAAVMLVPSCAIVQREGLRYVYVADSAGVARLRLLTVGEPFGSRVAVLSGLSAGESVITNGLDRIADGQPVIARAR